MQKTITKRFLFSLMALGFALITAAASAAGLAAIKVNSAFSQPFAAEIDITGITADDLLTAQVRMATPEEYESAKLTYMPILRSIRVALEQTGESKAILKLTSTTPITEPAITLLVEFSWRGGRIMQKYPILLDPPKQ